MIAIIFFGFLATCLNNKNLQSSVERGKPLYTQFCQTCHMDDGTGVEGVYPPLKSSDYLMEDYDRAIQQVLYGASIEMEVNGIIYNGNMDGYYQLDNQEIADIMNYVLNSWGNESKKMIKARAVRKQRKE